MTHPLLRGWQALVMASAIACTHAAAQAPPPLEQTEHISVTVKDLYGREETKQIPVLIVRPEGPGPFPLLVMNHGRAPGAQRAQTRSERFAAFTRYMVGKGFVVMLPTRVGYGETYGEFDPESNGGCAAMKLEAAAQAASEQVLATLAFAKTLPFVDASRWVVAGQSVGGFTAVATVSRHPDGLVGGINFAGGIGGDPERSPGQPCRPQRIEALWGEMAGQARVPMLWLYWENDEYWGAEVPQRWHDAWQRGGGQAEFHQLAAAGKKGHGAMTFDMAHWTPYADAFLARLGFPSGAAQPMQKTP